MEVLPCRGCCAQNPWATVLMREDAQANQLSEELDFSYSHDTLTGLANRSKYESDLRELQYSDYDSMVCTYIDVVGLHEVNDHLGHRSGDNLLCTIANAARKFFVSSRIYRVGGDEFVVLTPNLPPYDVWTASDRMRVFLREKDCEISVGIQNTNNLRKLEAAVNKAEQAMQQDKLAYYSRNGQERQLKGLNEKLERTLTQKRDAEHFLRVLAPKYRSVYVVNLQDDSVRPIILPDFFQKILDTSGGSFRAVITAYRDQYVMPESRDEAFEATGIPQQKEELDLITRQVVSHFSQPTMGVEEIQDLVENELMKVQPEVAKKYIIYRQWRNTERDRKTHIKHIMDGIVAIDKNDVNLSNANMSSHTPAGQMMTFASEITKDYTYKYLLPKKYAEAHRMGDIHIHDLDYYPTKTTTCIQYDLDDLFERGFHTKNGSIRTPQSIQSYATLATIIFQTNQNEQHGGQAIPAFDFFMAKGVLKSFQKIMATHLGLLLDIKGHTTDEKEILKGIRAHFHSIA